MRRAHWLRANKGVELPTHTVFFDTETKPVSVTDRAVEARLWFGWGCYTRRHRGLRWTPPQWLRFEDQVTFWDWIESLTRDKKKLYIFAHNLAFDATVTHAIRILRLRGWVLKGAIVDDPPSVLRYQRGNRAIVLLDTLNIFRMSLAQIGSYIGLDKLPMPDGSESPDKWDEYGRRDVEIIRLAMQKYWQTLRKWDLGNFAYTLPGQAFAAFRHRFLKTGIYIDDNGTSHDLARRSYAGGRVECFRIGKIKDRVHCLDINSQYPWIMSTLPTPTRLITTVRRTSESEILEWTKKWCVIADVTLQTDEPIFPLKQDGHLVFPVGRFRTALPNWELVEAIESGAVQRIHSASVYERSMVFRPYVEFFWDARARAREAGDDVLAWMCKLFLNSLYGKFGQAGRVFEDISLTNSDEIKVWVEWDADEKTLHKYRQFGGLVQEQVREGESRESHPAIAAHVTSGARLALWKLIQRAGKDDVLYCDTDSIFVTDVGLERLETALDPNKLGSLKLEWSSDSVEIRGLKDYTRDGMDKIKGVRASATRLGNNQYEQDVFRGFRGMLQHGDMDRQIITRTVKTLKREYLKGTVDLNGIVSPLRLPLPPDPDRRQTAKMGSDV